MELVPATALAALERYLGDLDKILPDAAVYLTGSAALGDWREGWSDIDILTVTARPLDEAELAAVEELHAAHPERPYLDAIYVDREVLGSPSDVGFPHVVNGEFRGREKKPDPVQWATLDRHGLTIRGPQARTLGATPDPVWLREWNLDNLGSYWRPLAARARTAFTERDGASPLPAEIALWGALGPGRLHCTIATGEIISKTCAADYTAALLPSYGPLLERAKASRLGDATVTFTVADGLAGCDLIDAVIQLAGVPEDDHAGCDGEHVRTCSTSHPA